jgi:hypothetical protein
VRGRPASLAAPLALSAPVDQGSDGPKVSPIERPLRALSIGLVSVLVLGALWATVLLTSHLINGGKQTDSAEALLTAGSTVWASNIIAFALLYWELDGGGSAARARRSREHPDLAFPQQLSPSIASADWRPRFYDYLYLGFTNATAFSPTDAMPLALWAKSTMALQALDLARDPWSGGRPSGERVRVAAGRAEGTIG